MADPYRHRYGRGVDPAPPVSFARGVGIYSPYYFRGSHHYVYYERGMADHFYASRKITKGSLAFLKWGFRIGIVGYSLLVLMMVLLIALIIGSTGFHPFAFILAIIPLILGAVCVVLLRFLHSRYKIDSRAFYLPYADKVYQETTCPNCGGISVYGMHHECPHCGNTMPPAAGPVYLE